MMRDRRKIPTAGLNPIWVKELGGDVTSGLARPLVVEIDIPPFSAREKRL
jgi:hypothetical protein